MEVNAGSKLSKLRRARKRVEELKGFQSHLSIYLIVNTSITIYKVIKSTMGLEEFLDFGLFAVWFFWGLGLLYHASEVYSFNPFFGKGWEERKIKEFMNEDKEQNRWN